MARYILTVKQVCLKSNAHFLLAIWQLQKHVQQIPQFCLKQKVNGQLELNRNHKYFFSNTGLNDGFRGYFLWICCFYKERHFFRIIKRIYVPKWNVWDACKFLFKAWCWICQGIANLTLSRLRLVNILAIFIVFQTFSIMLRPELWADHSKVPMEFSRFHSFALADTWQCALSSWKIQGQFPKCCATTGHELSSRIKMDFSVLIFQSSGVSVPTPW